MLLARALLLAACALLVRLVCGIEDEEVPSTPSRPAEEDATCMLQVQKAGPKTAGATVPDASLEHESAAPCQCVTFDPSWVAPTRTVPRCNFIDLGAADGNTLGSFLNDSYVPVASCPSGEWYAILVEANPRFNEPLAALQQQYGAKVQSLGGHAAYVCEGSTPFYLDTVADSHNYWASSMSQSSPRLTESVTVPTVNLNRLLFENSIPGDYSIVKMDIEGAEWDIVPCVAQSPSAKLMSALYVEVHDPSRGLTGTTPEGFEAATAALVAQGVEVPDYRSATL